MSPASCARRPFLARFTALLPVAAVLLSCEPSRPPAPPPASPGDADRPGSPGQAAPQATRKPPSTDRSEKWKEIDRLVSEQKMQEAETEVARLRQAAQAAGDIDDWTRGLVREVQLKSALHEYETAVAFLKEQPWPRDLTAQVTLNLYFVHLLVHYYTAYSFEIEHREKVESPRTMTPVALKSWTRDDLFSAIQKAYDEVWQAREALGEQPLSWLKDYLEPNNYPPGVRDTLRDAATYLYADTLASTPVWRPEHLAGVRQLDLPALLRGDAAAGKGVKLLDPAVHPLLKVGAILDDLEAWHRQKGQREAALGARLERLRHLRESFSQPADLALFRADLESRLQGVKDQPFWAVGQATLANLVREGGGAGSLVRAHALAEEGQRRFPDSIGGKQCLAVLKSIEAPEYQIASMSSDAPGKRSVEITHQNLPALYLRAYPLDLLRRLETVKDQELIPGAEEVRRLIGAGKPAAEWQADLQQTRDFQSHRSFVVPPLAKRGLYLIAASDRKDFALDQAHIEAVHLLVTDLVLRSQEDGMGGVVMTALSGATGKPVAGAEITLYGARWSGGRSYRKVEARTTDAGGRARFPYRGRLDEEYIPVGKKGPDLAVNLSQLSFEREPVEREEASALIYTDRSIYRPLQKISWKVVVYRGQHKTARYRTLPRTRVTVRLRDANYQEVATSKVTTNAYGTAAGEFVIPAGRLLGGWQIESTPSGSASVRVEEYKRPTFEARLLDPAAPLRLNQKAELTGEARYYFGLPVTSGAVKWRVTRDPVYPRFWGYLWNTREVEPGGQTVASGTAQMQEDGKFRVSFLPAAPDARASAGKLAREVSYRYQLSVDVTDEGGETHSASRSFRLGTCSVEAQLHTAQGFVLGGEAAAPATFDITRADLDGVPRAGQGSWRLTQLKQPAETPMPADEPAITGGPGPGDDAPPETRPDSKPETKPETRIDSAAHTPGDLQRPRWDTRYSPEASLHAWADGPEQGSGSLTHDAKGQAKVTLPRLGPGAYRLAYTTRDDQGAPYETATEFIVSDKAHPAAVALPLLLLAEAPSVPVGGTARLLIASGLADPAISFSLFRGGKLVEQRLLGDRVSVLELPISAADRGGFTVRVATLRDHQSLELTQALLVPWDDRQLQVEFATFRDHLRPGARETWRVIVKGPESARPEAGAAELLAYMYDRSLDLFAPHHPPDPLSLYPDRTGAGQSQVSLGQVSREFVSQVSVLPEFPPLTGDRLKFEDGYGIGGPGAMHYGGGPVAANGHALSRVARAPARARPAGAKEPPSGGEPETATAPSAAPKAEAKEKTKEAGRLGTLAGDALGNAAGPGPGAAVPLRENFAETAFFYPQLLTGEDGGAVIEFTVPDSVTSWSVWVHALTADLRAGSLRKEAQSIKELMVRPYLPRFLREGDQAELKVVVNNAATREQKGQLTLDILDPETRASLARDFGLIAGTQPFAVPPGGGQSLTFPLTAPRRIGTVAFQVVAKADDLSDGELRPLPVLPGRVHLSQSRFAALREQDQKTLSFPDLAREDDPSRINESLVVTVDGQLFYSVLQALPYLVNYPYECTEQTMNRFVSTGILSALFKDYPAIGRMAREFSKRDTPLERFDQPDPNRKMALEESPWLVQAKGGQPEDHDDLIKVLDPRVAQAQRDSALAKLRKAQSSSGGFPWWAGGPPSAYMTLYLMHGLARAVEFGVPVPRDMVQAGWRYLGGEFRKDYARELMKKDCCWEFLTFLNYVATAYPDPSWTAGGLSANERHEIADFSFQHWKQHTPYLKAYLALTLSRLGRAADARLVFGSVMDAAKTTAEQGTFFAPEERSWLWYNDTIETHAFALRTLMELMPKDPRKDGMVQWLLMNKKLNQWKSTRATAEVIDALVHYLKREGALGRREEATVAVGDRKVTYSFEPDRYTGKDNQLVIPGAEIVPRAMSAVTVNQGGGKGMIFASATWNFSTEKLPAQEYGDLFWVSRSYFKREHSGREFVLRPLGEGATLSPGDEVEVQLFLRAKSQAEYVHLRDPRAAGLEPDAAVSRYYFDQGLGVYEEVRDSGTNFFFERLPQGEYTFKYRLRANMAGTFRIGPATLQSMYAPEFSAYSAGATLTVKPAH